MQTTGPKSSIIGDRTRLKGEKEKFLAKQEESGKNIKAYGKGGSNPRPLACEASVITTRPYPFVTDLRGDLSLTQHSAQHTRSSGQRTSPNESKYSHLSPEDASTFNSKDFCLPQSTNLNSKIKLQPFSHGVLGFWGFGVFSFRFFLLLSFSPF